MPNFNQEPKFKRRRVIAGGLAALAIGAGLITAEKHVVSDANKNFDKNERQAIQTIKEADNIVLAIGSGAKYRTSPILASDSEAGPTTIAGTVPKGEVLVIDRPLKASGEYNGWVGFELKSGKAGDASKASISANADHLVWVKADDLSAQSSDGNSLVTEFNYGTYGSPVNFNSVSVHTDKSGEFISDNLKTGYRVGVASIMPDQTFETIVNRERLSVAN